MEKLARLNQIFVMFLPVVICLSSLVMGYFIVYFTMLEEYIQDYHQYSDDELELYFTITYTLLPIAAFVCKFMYTQRLSSTIIYSKRMEKIKC